MIYLSAEGSTARIIGVVISHLKDADHMKIIVGIILNIVARASSRITHDCTATSRFVGTLCSYLIRAVAGIECVAGTELMAHFMFNSSKKIPYICRSTRDSSCLALIITGRTTYDTSNIRTSLRPGLSIIILITKNCLIKEGLTLTQ